jgi:hypothetical protein
MGDGGFDTALAAPVPAIKTVFAIKPRKSSRHASGICMI